jgi:hypothetical protein
VNYEHDSTGLLEGWPQRVSIGSGIEVDTLFLAWLTHRVKKFLPKWELSEVLHEVWAMSAHLAAGFDPSKCKIETWLTNYIPNHLCRAYARQYRMTGCFNRPLTDGTGWIRCVGDMRQQGKFGSADHDSVLDSMQQPDEIVDDSYAEIIDVLLSDCTDTERESINWRLSGREDGLLARERGCTKSAVWASNKRAYAKMRKVAEEIGVTSERLW